MPGGRRSQGSAVFGIASVRSNAALIDVFREIDPELTLVWRIHPSLIAQAGQKRDPGLAAAGNLANVG